MINELIELSRALDQYGLLEIRTHPQVGKLGKSDCLVIEINQEQKPAAVRFLSKQETGKLWKHSKGNHNSFPGIRIQKPLLPAAESRKITAEQWKKSDVVMKRNLLLGLNYEASNPFSRDIQVTVWTREQLAIVESDDSSELAALRQLIRCFPTLGTQHRFYKDLLLLIQTKVPGATEQQLDYYRNLLVGQLDGAQQYVSGCMTYYEVYEIGAYECLVASATTEAALIKLLNTRNPEKVSLTAQGQCYVTGEVGQVVRNKYPNPNLPIIGLTYLYSNNSDTPCLQRYGRTGVRAFQVGESSVQQMNDAITYLTREERKNKTWRPFGSLTKDKPDLLLAYLSDQPDNQLLLADLMDEPWSSDDKDALAEKEGLYEELCAQVLGKMVDVVNRNQNAKVNLLILETLDPGRKQVAYARSISTKQFVGSVQAWLDDSKNLPPIHFYKKSHRKEIRFTPTCPGPGTVGRALKVHYVPGNAKAKPPKASAISIQSVYRLFLSQGLPSTGEDAFLKDCLKQAYTRTAKMLAAAGHFKLLQDRDHSFSLMELRRVMVILALFSILLKRLGIERGIYMASAVYQVGQLLQLADRLHKQYCIHVRNGGDSKKSLPPQLLGNTLLGVAEENPAKALSMLSQRLRVYAAWADTSTDQHAKLAKWIMNHFRKTSSTFENLAVPERLNYEEKAQLLLGYLAELPDLKGNAIPASQEPRIEGGDKQ